MQLNDIKQKLSKKGTLKKITKIHEKVGAIKAKLSRIGWLYDIKYTEDKIWDAYNMTRDVVTVNNEKDEKIYVKLCTRLSKDQKAIFDALDFKNRPFVRKTKVLTQM